LISAKQTSRLQVVLESSKDHDHAYGNGECRGNNASKGEAVGSDSNVACSNGSQASHGVAHVAICSKVASR
jgi:hypothetical protein